jgi:hypothetical protein
LPFFAFDLALRATPPEDDASPFLESLMGGCEVLRVKMGGIDGSQLDCSRHVTRHADAMPKNEYVRHNLL